MYLKELFLVNKKSKLVFTKKVVTSSSRTALIGQNRGFVYWAIRDWLSDISTASQIQEFTREIVIE